MNISLTPHLEKFINDRLASGRYTSASEVVRESLRLLEQQESARRSLQGQLRKGLHQARRGKLLDGETVLADLEASLRPQAKRRKAG